MEPTLDPGQRDVLAQALADAVSYRDPPLYCRACETQDGLCEQCALGSTAAGMLLWNLAVSRLPGTRVSLLLCLEPLVSVAGAVALLGEHLSAAMLIGGALVLAGVISSATASAARSAAPAAAG